MSEFNNNFLLACKRQPVSRIPAWIMRQAGRYQPEYRHIRKSHSLIEICKQPDLCAEVTLLPVTQLDVDAAILFSDITLPFEGMGIPFDIKENIGPVIENPVRDEKALAGLRSFDPEESLPWVGESIRILNRELKVPLIGFAGAPFTLASYMIEGGPSKRFVHTKSMMYKNTGLWNRIMEKLTDMVIVHLTYQVNNGTQALQIFDSWIGNLDISDYRTYVMPHMKRLFQSISKLNVPVIHFGVGTGHLIENLQEAGGDVIGLDWRTNITSAWKRLEYKCSIQGNLDPTVLFAPENIIREKTLSILNQIDRPGYIFNLGHGILPETNPEILKKLIDFVHAYDVEKSHA
jgi:uroporphyrinogen decarboxylase